MAMDPSTICISFIKSQKGKDMALFGPYAYGERPCADPEKRIWQCSNWRCWAKLWTETDTNRVIKNTNNHNHAPEHEKLAVKIAMSKMKEECLANPLIDPNDVIAKGRERLSETTLVHFPAKRFARQTLVRYRKKMMIESGPVESDRPTSSQRNSATSKRTSSGGSESSSCDSAGSSESSVSSQLEEPKQRGTRRKQSEPDHQNCLSKRPRRT